MTSTIRREIGIALQYCGICLLGIGAILFHLNQVLS